MRLPDVARRIRRRHTADITVQGTEGRRAVVRTGWLVSHEIKEAHLVTLYVKK